MKQPTKVSEITPSEQVEIYKRAACLIDLETERLIDLGAAPEQVFPGSCAYYYLTEEIKRLQTIMELN